MEGFNAIPLIPAESMKCRLVQIVDRPRYDVFIGEDVATYCDERRLRDGVVDFAKGEPFMFVMNDHSYWRLGKRLGQVWEAGKNWMSSADE
jgi:flavin reductase (DIM6/NTAB) family NADH-FMN oxidoreductase RutF